MNYIHAHVSRFMRMVLVVVVCGLMVLSTALPAYAIGSSRSNPSEGEVKLNDVQRRSGEVLNEEPRSMDEVRKTAEGGINEIQGASDYDKMSRPDNSQDADSVPDQIKRTFDALTDR